MPRTDIPITRITRAGVTPPSQVNGDTSNNHSIAFNDGTIYLEVENTDGSNARTITLVIAPTVDGQAVANKTVSIPSGNAIRRIGPFPPAIYNQADGTVHFNVDHANLRLRAYQVS